MFIERFYLDQKCYNLKNLLARDIICEYHIKYNQIMIKSTKYACVTMIYQEEYHIFWNKELYTYRRMVATE